MRNKELTQLRDKRLVDRFYQLYDIQRMRLDDVLNVLSRKEFYLDSNYIYKRIFYHNGNHRYYDSLKEAVRKAKSK